MVDEYNNVMEPWIEPIPTRFFNYIRNCLSSGVSKRHLAAKVLFIGIVIITFAQRKQLCEMKQKNTDLTLELAALQRDYTEQSGLLHEHQNLSNIYENQLALIKIIGEQIQHMDICYSQLESYSTRRISTTWRSEGDNEMMSRLAGYMGCERKLTPSYYLRIKDSFYERISSCKDFKSAQIELTLNGDYEKMKAEQQRNKHLPAKTCQFLCHLEEKQSNWISETIWIIITKLVYGLVY